MGSCWKQKAKDYLWAQVGEVCGKSSAYAKEMDAVNYYNYPKNGAANSCALFCDNSLLHACTGPSYDEDPDGAKWTALAAMYEPQAPGANAGAGCVQKVGYFRAAGAYYTDPQDFCELDEIFFASPDYISAENPEGLYHTGMIVSWGYIEELGADGFTTIEGNTTYEGEAGRVAYKYYAYDDPRIHGAGRPNWDGWEPQTAPENPTQEKPKPEPTEPTEPTPEPQGVYYVRIAYNQEKDSAGEVLAALRLRSSPEHDATILALIPNGEKVTVDKKTGDGWAHINYGRVVGWANMAYLFKI